jgi:hypothetical protein
MERTLRRTVGREPGRRAADREWTRPASSVLALQRLAGNRAVAALIAARATSRPPAAGVTSRPPAAGVTSRPPDAAPTPGRTAAGQGGSARRRSAVQRKVFLANADANIYQDDARAGLDLAFVDVSEQKIGKKRPMFIAYADFTRLSDAMDKAWAELGADPSFGPYLPSLDAWAKAWLTDNNHVKTTQLYWEDPDGNLCETAMGPADVYAFKLAQAIVHGPRHWNTGGGSRLPPARGCIYANGLKLADVLGRLGVSSAEFGKKFKNVRFVELENFPYIQQLLTAQDTRANVVVYDDFFYASDVVVTRAKSSRFQAAGQYYDERFSSVGAGSEDERRLKSSLDSLKAPVRSDWAVTFSPRDRGDGQTKAMGGWNALGAAAFANRIYGSGLSLDKNWEWLHVRGAQIGGATQAGNLVPGLFVTNSAMIPYEKQIAVWAQRGAGLVWARFDAAGGRGVFATKIVIQIGSKDHPELGTIKSDDPLEVVFDPLRGAVVDKMMGRIHQRRFARQQEAKRKPGKVEIILDAELPDDPMSPAPSTGPPVSQSDDSAMDTSADVLGDW